jgi:hypothetical protein
MGVHKGGVGAANDDPFEQYRKRMMLGYKSAVLLQDLWCRQFYMIELCISYIGGSWDRVLQWEGR